MYVPYFHTEPSWVCRRRPYHRKVGLDWPYTEMACHERNPFLHRIAYNTSMRVCDCGDVYCGEVGIHVLPCSFVRVLRAYSRKSPHHPTDLSRILLLPHRYNRPPIFFQMPPNWAYDVYIHSTEWVPDKSIRHYSIRPDTVPIQPISLDLDNCLPSK